MVLSLAVLKPWPCLSCISLTLPSSSFAPLFPFLPSGLGGTGSPPQGCPSPAGLFAPFLHQAPALASKDAETGVFRQYCASVINLSSTHFQTSQKSCSRPASTSAVTTYSWCHPSCLLISLCPQIVLLRSPLASYSPVPRLCLQPHSLKHLRIKVLNLGRLLGARTPPPYFPQN